jgi:hypothetical protein
MNNTAHSVPQNKESIFQIPFERIFHKDERAALILRALWLILPMEFWINNRIGAFSPDAIVPAFAFVFYKALCLVFLSWLFFGGAKTFAAGVRDWLGITKRRVDAAGRGHTGDSAGMTRTWSATLFALWFAVSVVISLSHLLSLTGLFTEQRDFDVLGSVYMSSDPHIWCAACGNYPKEGLVIVIVNFVYVVIAALLLCALAYCCRRPALADCQHQASDPNVLKAIGVMTVVQSAFQYLVFM